MREGNNGSDGIWWARKLQTKQSKQERKKKQQTDGYGKFTPAVLGDK